MADPIKPVMLQVRGQDPLTADVPLFSNFVGISRVGTEVQLEFIFLDLNQLALLVDGAKKGEIVAPQELVGKTVTKIVMPGLSFYQLRDHLKVLFEALEGVLKPMEVAGEHEPQRSRSK